MVSVPLRGYGFEIVQIGFRRRIYNEVSVPLRGYGFEILAAGVLKESNREGFPSPYGDMVLKFYLARKIRVRTRMFPSPYGDMVLKCLYRMRLRSGFRVSVPLRGYGFEM